MLAAAISCVGGSGFGGVAGCGEFGVVVISLPVVGASDHAGDTLPIVEVTANGRTGRLHHRAERQHMSCSWL